MTCPSCGALAPLAALRARPLKCPACGRGLEVYAPWDPLVLPAALLAPLCISLWLGLQGYWLAVGTVVGAPAAWSVTSVALLAFWPPHLRLSDSKPPAPRRRHQFGHWFGTEEPPITLGLSAQPPPQPKPEDKPNDDSC